MRDYEKIFLGLPKYVDDTWWQEHFAKKFEGAFKGSHNGIYSRVLWSLAEKMKEGLERSSVEASDFIGSIKVNGEDIYKSFNICSKLTSESCPHIDIVKLSLTYYKQIDKWVAEIIGGNSKIGYQGDYPLLGSQNIEVIKDFLASDEFVVVSMHQLFECDEQMRQCEMDVRSW